MKTILALLLAASTSFGAIYTPGSGGSGSSSSSGTNFAGLLLTNHLLRVVHDAGSNDNLTLPISVTNAVVWSPRGNPTLTLSGSWVSGIRQVIDLTLVLTNGQTSVTLPYAGPGGATVAIQTPPSTNALAIVSDGTRQWIESGVAAVNTNQFSSDGSAIKSGASYTNVILYGSAQRPSGLDFQSLYAWTQLDGQWDNSLDESWAYSAAVNGRWGREDWTQVTSGTINIPGYARRSFGSIGWNGRSVGARHALFTHAGVSTTSTNMEILYLDRFMASSLNSTALDTNTFRAGMMDSTSAEPSNGIYWRTTNDVHELVTARSGSYTVSTTPSNLVAMSWVYRAWYLDNTGTNVYGYIGGAIDSMTRVCTNTLTIPHDQKTQPIVFHYQVNTNAAVAGVTNYLDITKIWVRPFVN